MTYEYEQYLAHHGIKGQKWGVRRFQNEDGSLTEEGIRRYQKLTDENNRNRKKYFDAEDEFYDEHDQKISDPDYENRMNKIESNMKKADKRLWESTNKLTKFGESIDLDKYVRSKYSNKTIDSITKSYNKHLERVSKLESKYGDVTVSRKSREKAIKSTRNLYKKVDKKHIDLNDRLTSDWFYKPKK